MERIKLSFSSHCLPRCQNLILCLPPAIHLNSHSGTGNISLCLKNWGALWCSYLRLCEGSKSRTGKYCPQAVSHLWSHMEANSINQSQHSLLTSNKRMSPAHWPAQFASSGFIIPEVRLCKIFFIAVRKEDKWVFARVRFGLAASGCDSSWAVMAHTSVLEAVGLADKTQFKQNCIWKSQNWATEIACPKYIRHYFHTQWCLVSEIEFLLSL